MDPQATLTRINDAIAQGEYLEAGEAMDDLTSWLDKGGYTPNGAIQIPVTAHALRVLAQWMHDES